MWSVFGFVVEVVDGYGEVVGWIEEGWVDIGGGLAAEEMGRGMVVALSDISIVLEVGAGG